MGCAAKRFRGVVKPSEFFEHRSARGMQKVVVVEFFGDVVEQA